MEEREPYRLKLQLDVDTKSDTGEVEYDRPLIEHLLSLLDNGDKEILRSIHEATEDSILNYQKTKVPDYQRLRRKYDISWGKLEAQGFIRPLQVAQLRLFVLTENGQRAIAVLNETTE